MCGNKAADLLNLNIRPRASEMLYDYYSGYSRRYTNNSTAHTHSPGGTISY